MTFFASFSLPAASIIIENKMDDTLYLYSDPKAYFFHGDLIKNIPPHTIDTSETKKWVRLRSDSYELFDDIYIGKFSKRVVVSSKDSIIISSLTDDLQMESIDSLIYLSNENYFVKDCERDLSLSKDFQDSIKTIIKYGEFIPPKFFTVFIRPIVKQFYTSNTLNDTSISLYIREYLVYSITTYLIAHNSQEREVQLKSMLQKIKVESPKLYQLLSKNKRFEYIMKNVDFYDRVTDFLNKIEIKVDTTKINIIYFTSSWCQYCIQDFKKISEGDYNMKNVDLYIIALEDDEKGEIKLMSLLKDISIDYKLKILRGGTNSIYNERLGVQAVPQIYLYDKKDNSEHISVILSYYLENLNVDSK